MIRFFLAAFLAALVAATAAGPYAATPADEPVDWDRVKREWSRLTPSEQREWSRRRDEAVRRLLAERPPVKTPGEACDQATYEIGDLPFQDIGTTLGRFDNLNLSFTGACIGGGVQDTATGLGPDLVYKIQVDVQCDLGVTLQPATVDLALYVITTCSNPSGSCVWVSDGGAAGQSEHVDFTATAGVNYFLVVDGYFGASGAFAIDVVENGGAGCRLVPVELLDFSVE